MTNEQMVKVLKGYCKLLEKNGNEPVRNNEAKTQEAKLNHTLWMCYEAQDFIKQEKYEKANRWLGFIQGVLWCNEIHSINEMRGHNR